MSLGTALIIKIFTICLLASIVTGAAIAAAAIVLTIRSPIDWRTQSADIVVRLLLSSMPISIPLGLLGGVVATWAVRHENERSWVRRGTMVGVVIGSLGAAFAAFAFSTAWAVWVIYGILGSVAGGICGAVVGLLTSRLRKNRR